MVGPCSIGADMRAKVKSDNKRITLRDRFAVAALPALIERYEYIGEAELRGDQQEIPEDTSAGWEHPDHWDKTAITAYAVADAMLKARESKP